ncbi:hypothetical protein MKW98_028572 [Papaver atlanticum]|uniref:Uncharacterized protein n=1 Tax=Papaver atlanticum TaxID=357466 RepID=A0AAD4TA94_9MAGN|nr:hypothetical protein MKW98_028572 [Papaver atlanticum]
MLINKRWVFCCDDDIKVLAVDLQIPGLQLSYEGRCGLHTDFDYTYCYALGYAAGALLHAGKTVLISSVGNLSAPVEEWTVGGTTLTVLMDVERTEESL